MPRSILAAILLSFLPSVMNAQTPAPTLALRICEPLVHLSDARVTHMSLRGPKARGFEHKEVGTPLCAGEPSALPDDLLGRSDILFYSGFETTPWEEAWGMVWGPSPSGNISLIEGKKAFAGRSLRVRYPKGLIGGDSACQWLTSFKKLGLPPREECFVRYTLRFDPKFDFVKGGKLPGLVGGDANTGGKIPNGRDGWSARLMWRPGGKIVQYVYHPDQKGQWGEDFAWEAGGKARFFKPGVWHCVETYVKMNTPGKHDGVIRSWLDGELALEVMTLRFRDTQELQIDAFYFSTFFGGGDPSWAPSRDQAVQFDDFVLSSAPVGPGPRRTPSDSLE